MSGWLSKIIYAISKTCRILLLLLLRNTACTCVSTTSNPLDFKAIRISIHNIIGIIVISTTELMSCICIRRSSKSSKIISCVVSPTRLLPISNTISWFFRSKAISIPSSNNSSLSWFWMRRRHIRFQNIVGTSCLHISSYPWNNSSTVEVLTFLRS